MEKLKQISERKGAERKSSFKRFLFSEIDWQQPLILLLGHRGAGKTTLLLQAMQERNKNSIYLSLDNIYFEANRLVNAVDNLYAEGYRHFFLDEVHRYEYWSKDLKNLYDNYSDIKVVATGSSILEISKGQADLSRRIAVYHLPGLSFREYLVLQYGDHWDAIDIHTILEKHQEIAADFFDKRDVLKSFKDYLQYGYYPFFKEGIKTYPSKLMETSNLILDLDIVMHEQLQYSTLRNLKKLLYVISQSVPFKPNVSKLANKLEISRNTILKMFDLMNRAQLINLLHSDTSGISYLQKPEKIYLQNTNLAYRFASGQPEKGNLRETFFFNQLQVKHKITSSKSGDFMVDDQFTFEIGGPDKTQKQIKGLPNAYIVADEIKGGAKNKIPLWLFGFLY